MEGFRTRKENMTAVGFILCPHVKMISIPNFGLMHIFP